MNETPEIDMVRAARKSIAKLAGMDLTRLGEILRERERFANEQGYHVFRETLQAIDKHHVSTES